MLYGTIIELNDGYAVETVFDCQSDGKRYLHRRPVNGVTGNIELGPVSYAGCNTWNGKGFTVAADEYPHPNFTIVETPKRKRK